MKRSLFLLAILALAVGLSGQRSGRHLEGCADPMVIAKALAKIAKMRWRDITVERLQAIWPTEPWRVNRNCTDGLVTTDHRPCGEEFCFAVDQSENRSAGERLSSIDIWYSAPKRSDVAIAAKAFARAAGLPDAKIGSLGRDPSQDRDQEFQWDTALQYDPRNITAHRVLSEGRERELSTLSVAFVGPRGGYWTLSFLWARKPTDPPARRPRAP